MTTRLPLLALLLLAGCDAHEVPIGSIDQDLGVSTDGTLVPDPCHANCAACPNGFTCVSWHVSGPVQSCLQPCTVNADCPASAPTCVEILQVEVPNPPGRYCLPSQGSGCAGQGCFFSPLLPRCTDGGVLEGAFQNGEHCGTTHEPCPKGCIPGVPMVPSHCA